MTKRSLTPYQRLLHRTSYRITHKTKLPKGDVVAFLRNLAARGFYPENIVDVGANRGRWSQKARTVFPRSRYTLIEPQIEMKPLLDRFCADTPGARWINAGAGSRNAVLPFTLTAPNSSTFAYTPEEAGAGGWKQREVEVVTLDHVCAEVIDAVPELVKIDAEGFEFEIMKGASNLVGRTEVFLLELPLFEPLPCALSFAEAVGQMSEYGYAVYDFTTFIRRPCDNAIGLCEVAFARQDGFLRSFKGFA